MANRYIDFSNSSGTLTGTWTFTNGNATVNAAGADGNALAEVAVGDYVRQSDGTQWYKVTAVPDDDNITITPVFQQATHTDDIGASLYNLEDGSAADGNAFCHHNQATTDEGRVAGDVVRVRGGLTYTYAGIDITMDEDATPNSYIELRGIYTAAGDNSWGDGDTARPIIDFASTNNNVNPSGDRYWKMSGFDVKDSHDSTSAITLDESHGFILEDCRLYDNGVNSGDGGIRIRNCANVKIIDCSMDNNFGFNIQMVTSDVYVSGCVLDGDAGLGSSAQSTDYGVSILSGNLFIKDTILGASDHDSQDIRLGTGDLVYGRNVKLDSATEVVFAYDGSMIMIEDDQQVHLAFRGRQFNGTIARSATYERSGAGGTAWSIKMEANSNCGDEQPLYGIGDWLRGISVYLDGTEQTITIYALCHDNVGATYTSADKFRSDIEHYEGVAVWDKDSSDEDFAAEDVWKPFTVTLTPGAAGPAALKARLLEYNANHDLYIDPKPEFS